MKISKNVRLMAMLVLMVTLSLALFTGGANSATKPSTSDKTLSIALASTIATMDPKISNDRYSSNIYRCIYESLLTYDKNKKIVANSIVKEYRRVNDVTYNFKLVKGIYFDNGEELKASDVKFSLERGIGTSINYLVGDIKHVDVLGDYEFNIVIKAPNGAFLAALTTPQTGILNKEAVTKAGNSYQLHPIGTGPYKFVSWEQGVSVTLERKVDYYGKAPFYKKLVFKEITDDTTRANQLESGGVNAASISAIDVSRFSGNRNFMIVKAPTYGLVYIGMNYNSKNVKNQIVRQAIAYAINTSSIAKAAYLGYAKVATSILNPNVTFSIANELKPNQYNPDKAKALLAQAGYKNRSLKLTLVIDNRTDVTAVGTMVKEYLNKVGIDCKIVTGDKTTMSGSYYAKGAEYDIFVGTWYCATSDANTQIFQTFHSFCNGATGGYVWMHRDDIDKKIETARASLDSKKRAELYKEIQQLVYTEKWWVPVLYYVDCWGVAKDVDISACLDPTGQHLWWKAVGK
jgi:peptide/nickel transport system substrate-binding protein